MKLVVEFAFTALLGAVGLWVLVISIGLIYGLLLIPLWGLLTWRRRHAKG